MCSADTVKTFISNINANRNNPQSSEKIVPLEYVIEFEDATLSTDLSLGKFFKYILLRF